MAMSAKKQAGSDPSAWGVNLCCVCGQLAKSACSKCRSARYCGREHQSQHWKSGGHKEVSLQWPKCMRDVWDGAYRASYVCTVLLFMRSEVG